MEGGVGEGEVVKEMIKFFFVIFCKTLLKKNPIKSFGCLNTMFILF